MSSAKNKYWQECLASSFEENGIIATKEQLISIAKDVQIWAENIDTAFYTPENPLISEVKTLKDELRKERNKVVCRECAGRGRIISYGPSYSSESDCGKCHGKGWI